MAKDDLDALDVLEKEAKEYDKVSDRFLTVQRCADSYRTLKLIVFSKPLSLTGEKHH